MPSTRTTRTKRIPSNHKRTNNKPKLLPVIISYCLSGWTKVPLQPESQQQLRCILIAAMAGFRTPGQHWEAATPMIAMFSVLGFPSQNAKIHYPVKKVCSFFEYRISCIKWFCLPMFRPKPWCRQASKTKEQSKRFVLTFGGQIHVMGKPPKNL